jgi:alkylated DNA repair dioxygenase AlkB
MSRKRVTGRNSSFLRAFQEAMRRSSLKAAPPAEADLFGRVTAWPQGLRYELEFLSEEEEWLLIDAFSSLRLAPFQFGAFEGKRRVASFGSRFDFSDQRLHAAEPPPEFLQPFKARAEAFAGLAPDAVQHVLLTEYETGAGIGWHRDKVAFNMVIGISLGSACPLRFRRKEPSSWERFTLEAAPRSVYLLSGEARSLWEHSIPPVQTPRWSITLRTMAP